MCAPGSSWVHQGGGLSGHEQPERQERSTVWQQLFPPPECAWRQRPAEAAGMGTTRCQQRCLILLGGFRLGWIDAVQTYRVVCIVQAEVCPVRTWNLVR